MKRIYSGVEVTYQNETDYNQSNVVYLITFPNGKHYVGQTTKKLETRILQHCRCSSCCHKLNNATNKYKTFHVDVLFLNQNISILNSFEIFFIKLFDTTKEHGYNLQKGGRNKPCSEGTRKILKDVMTGKKHKTSERSINACRENAKKVTPEGKERFRTCNIGRKHSEEWKQKMSEIRKGKPNKSMFKKVRSIPDDITFESCVECERYYSIRKYTLNRYYNGAIHTKSGQTFELV